MKEFPIIETKNLLLRTMLLKDFDNYYDYVTDNLVSKQFMFNCYKETANKRFQEILERYNNDVKPNIWVIAIKDTDELIGIVSFCPNKFFELSNSINIVVSFNHFNFINIGLFSFVNDTVLFNYVKS